MDKLLKYTIQIEELSTTVISLTSLNYRQVAITQYKYAFTLLLVLAAKLSKTDESKKTKSKQMEPQRSPTPEAGVKG